MVDEEIQEVDEAVEVEEVQAKKNFILIIITLINFTVLIVLFVRQIGLNDKLLEFQKEHLISRGVQISTETSAKQLFELKPMSINLAEWNGPRRYLKITPRFEIDAKNIEELEAKKSIIRDVIIKIANKKNPDDLLSDGGVEKIKSEMVEGINKVLSQSKIIRVYFIDYRVN